MPTPIYVETSIGASLDELWRLTQDPSEHQQWDLRFSAIEYLPRLDPGSPQRFRYTTKIGFGLEVKGEGETVGEKFAEASRTSALRFWSQDPKSLIEEGSGFWKYEPEGETVRFYTRYDYTTRFRRIGRLADATLFRPMLGWATAWSFDRLRLRLEQGIAFSASLHFGLVYFLCRAVAATAWFFHGIVPKLVWPNVEETAMLRPLATMLGLEADSLLRLVGSAEVFFGLLVVLLWRSRTVLYVHCAAMVLLAAGAATTRPAVFLAPFNPFTLNLALLTIGVTALISEPFSPSAGRCLRQPRNGA